MADPVEIAEKLAEANRLHRDLTANWDAFCDADPLDDPNDVDGFPERLEAAGYAELVAVDDDALETPFADERGIYPGGLMWRLTPLGIAVRSCLKDQQQ